MLSLYAKTFNQIHVELVPHAPINQMFFTDLVGYANGCLALASKAPDTEIAISWLNEWRRALNEIGHIRRNFAKEEHYAYLRSLPQDDKAQEHFDALSPEAQDDYVVEEATRLEWDELDPEEQDAILMDAYHARFYNEFWEALA